MVQYHRSPYWCSSVRAIDFPSKMFATASKIRVTLLEFVSLSLSPRSSAGDIVLLLDPMMKSLPGASKFDLS